MFDSDSPVSRRQFATGTLSIGASVTGLVGLSTVTGDDESEAIAEAVETHYHSEPGVYLDSVNRINRQHLPGDTVVAEVDTSNGQRRVFLEDRDNSWEIIKTEPGL